MRVLIVKMSSMGDVIHTLPAITDACRAVSDVKFDWVVEPGFAEIPRWHPNVNKVISAPLRQWRKAPWKSMRSGQCQALFKQLRETPYDCILDAQGLVKSAIVSCLAKGKRFGYDKHSAKESIVSASYHKRFSVPMKQHAVERTRALFAQALGYSIPDTAPDYGIDPKRLPPFSVDEKNIVFLHSTTWESKHWPLSYWQSLAIKAAQSGFKVLLPWGSIEEYERANAIRDHVAHSQGVRLPIVLPKLSLGELASMLDKVNGVVAVDTGLGHVAAAMGAPTVSLYGPTDPSLTGAYGPNQHHLSVSMSCSPCFQRICPKPNDAGITPPCFRRLPPEHVWENLLGAMA